MFTLSWMKHSKSVEGEMFNKTESLQTIFGLCVALAGNYKKCIRKCLISFNVTSSVTFSMPQTIENVTKMLLNFE